MKRLAIILIAACGSPPKTPDAHVADAPVDVATDAAPDASTADYHYVISKQRLPISSNTAHELAFDLDGNGTPDNQLGGVFSALRAQGGFDMQYFADNAVARGTVIMLADVDLAVPSFAIYQGTNANPSPCNGSADTTCGHHLTGTASFTAAAMPRDTALTGSLAAGVLTAGPGHVSVGITAFGSTTITLLAAHAQLAPMPTGFMMGKVGGAMTLTDRDMKLYPAMKSGITAETARDCTLTNPPGCGCLSGTQAAEMIAFFDANHDCSVSLSELQTNSLMMSLLQADVTVEGQQAISVGFGVDAVDATFTP